MLPITFKMAKLADFRAPTTRILFGERLKQVAQIQSSIDAHGLLNPLVVMRHRNKLVVVDGKKRLAALRRMRFSGELPRSLVNVPYITTNQETCDQETPMSLLSNRERYEEVLKMRKMGYGLMQIAAELYVSKNCVRELLYITRLSPRLRKAFFSDTLTMAQARAFAALPSPEAQDQLFLALGPFANAPDILSAIEAGETVINIENDNVIILPSRRPLTPYHTGPEDLAA